MDQEIETLFEKINNDYEPMSKGGLTGLGDRLEYGEWDEKSYKEVLRRLMDIYFKKNTSLDHKREVHKTIGDLILCSPFEFSFEDFKPMITVLERGTDYFTMASVLHMLKSSTDLKFLPLVEKFVSHREENVREQAIETANWIKEVNGLE